MKFLKLAAPALALGFMLFNQSSQAEEDAVRLACSPFPPFKIKDSQGERLGIDVDVIRAAFRETGHNTRVSFFPWKRALRLAEVGETDVICGCSYLPEREMNFIFSDVLGHHSQGIFLAENAPIKQIQSLADLQGLRVAAVRGYALNKELAESGAQVIEADNDKQLLKLLLAGRVDAVYTYRDILLYNYAHSGSSGDISYFETSSQPYYLCLSRQVAGMQSIAEDFNRGLRIIRYNGTYQEIWDSYR